MTEPNRSTVIYLIRHGEPIEPYQGKFYGQLDVPLSEKGRRQSLATAERLGSIPFGAIYSSDLQRAGFLADALAQPRDLPVRKVADFRERNVGEFQGLSEEELHRRDPEQFALWKADRITHRWTGGENFEDVQRRVVPAVQTLAQNFDGQRVALVSHAGPIRVTLAHFLGMPLAAIFNLVVDYGCVNVIEFPTGGTPRVKMVNG